MRLALARFKPWSELPEAYRCCKEREEDYKKVTTESFVIDTNNTEQRSLGDSFCRFCDSPRPEGINFRTPLIAFHFVQREMIDIDEAPYTENKECPPSN